MSGEFEIVVYKLLERIAASLETIAEEVERTNDLYSFELGLDPDPDHDDVTEPEPEEEKAGIP